VLYCKALPYENESFIDISFGILFNSFNILLASSSDNPPDKKTIPGTLSGITLCIKAKDEESKELYPFQGWNGSIKYRGFLVDDNGKFLKGIMDNG